jgi:alpha-N-arabinofuranosidase
VGTIQVQEPGGRPRASGRSHFGTSDWLEESVPFRVPADGRVRAALFLAGFGKGTGTVWFDGLRLEPLPAPGIESLRVKPERLRDAPISPFQCGQFVEFLCDLVPSMHAERLFDDSFEGYPPPKVKYRPETDVRARPWYPSGAVHRGEYTLDRENPWNGSVSLRIRAGAGEPCTLGIAQDGIDFPANEPLHFRVYLRGSGLEGKPLEAAARLGAEGRVLARAGLGLLSGEWRKHEAVLVPSTSARDATLTIEFQGPGTVWIDRASLLPESAAPGGWRPDVVAALRELRPAIIRIGGTAMEGYEWESGVGDIDRRPPFTTVWGCLEPNRVGLEEFITLCRLVEAEPLICVRWTGKNPEDAAAEVEYLNGPPESAHGKRRALNGHPEPYRVRYFQVGNEVSGARYEETVAGFAAAMRRVDPSIKVLSSYPSERILENAAPLLDYLSPHHYGCADLGRMEADIESLRELVKRRGGGRPIRLAVTEWNTTAGDWGLGRASLLTLGNGLSCARYHNLMQRHADFLEIAIRSNLTNSFCSGIIQTRGPDLYLAPTYHVQALYRRAAGDFPLRVETLLPSSADDLDSSATVTAGGKALRLYVVNDSPLSRTRTIDLRPVGEVQKEARLFLIADRDGRGERDAANGFEDRERIRAVESEIALPGLEFPHTFPALSVSLLEIGLRR